VKNTLWVEKYRPNTLDGYVFVDENQKNQITQWIKDKSIPHLLLTGDPGTGKTTLAKILINMLDIHKYDILEINASRENGVDHIRDKITGFVSTIPHGSFKIVLLDEADFMSQSGQAVLRGVMEMYNETARFILTANYAHKIIPALHSRCQGFHINSLDKTEFAVRAAEILATEDIEFEIEDLDVYVDSTYPDLRKCINLLQANSSSGKLVVSSSSIAETDYMTGVVKLFKDGKYREARKLLCNNITRTDVDGIITWAYNNLNIWADDPNEEDDAIIIIRDAAARVPLIADPEINISAMLVELTKIKENRE